MVDEKARPADQARRRQKALARWENEGGAASDPLGATPELTNAELVQLRIRVIALEGLAPPGMP